MFTHGIDEQYKYTIFAPDGKVYLKTYDRFYAGEVLKMMNKYSGQVRQNIIKEHNLPEFLEV